MPSLLISYKKDKKELVLESLAQLKGFITYRSEIINLVGFYTEVNENIVKAIDGVLAVSEKGSIDGRGINVQSN